MAAAKKESEARDTDHSNHEAGEKRKHDELKEEEVDSPEAEEDVKQVKPAADATEGEAADEEGPSKKAAKRSSPLDWLLSDEAFDMANPEIPKGHGEVDWADGPHKKAPPRESAGHQSKGNEEILRYPQSHLTPFQNLIAACLLSKPISHKLGLRTIQTLLNPPFGLRTLGDLDEAGFEGRRKVMWEARTQHKEKTATQLGHLVDGVRELCAEDASEDDLSEIIGVREQIKGLSPADAAQKVEELLTEIKYIGPGVAAIFLRRVQGDWEEVFPYADERSLAAARKFGLIGAGGSAEDLADKVGKDRGKFVRLLDTLIGLDLEKVLDEAFSHAGA